MAENLRKIDLGKKMSKKVRNHLLERKWFLPPIRNKFFGSNCLDNK